LLEEDIPERREGNGKFRMGQGLEGKKPG